jgi:hypothetical protein
MHHMSWVRRDIEQKLRNSSASVRWKSRIPEMVQLFNDFEIAKKMAMFDQYHYVYTEDKFNLTQILQIGC